MTSRGWKRGAGTVGSSQAAGSTSVFFEGDHVLEIAEALGGGQAEPRGDVADFVRRNSRPART
jgi:hypothetical protein